MTGWLLVGLGAVGLAVLAYALVRPADPLQAAASELGLTLRDGVLVGQIEGVPLRVEPPAEGRGWRLRAGLAREAAPLELGPGDPVEHPVPEVERALRDRVELGCRVRIGEALHVTAPDPGVEPLTGLALATVVLARALDARD